MPIYASSAKSAKADAVILGSVAGRCDPNSVGVPTRYLYRCLTIKTKCSASPGGNYRVSRHDAIMPITHSFHPLPDRDRYRIASGLWVRRLPPVAVTLLLIVWVTLSGDTRNVLAEHVGIEPTHPFLNDGLATRCLNRSANAP